MSEIPQTTGQFDPTQSVVPAEAQHIYDVATDYRGAVEFAYGSDIAETADGELDALQAVTTIGYVVENNPDHQLSREQQGMLAAAEAHAGALKTATSLSEQQNATLANLNQSQQTADVVSTLARERYDLYRVATDPEERIRLGSEMRELKDYADIIANNNGVADISSIEGAVHSYTSNGEDVDLAGKAFIETKANAYFAKYAQEIAAKPTSTPEERRAVMSDDEVAAARKMLQGLNDNTANAAPEQSQAVEAARRSVEQAHSAELFNDVVKLSKNRTLLDMGVETGYKYVGDGSKDYRKLNIPVDLNDYYKSPSDWRQGLNEVVMFTDVADSVSGEPAVRFRYQFKFIEKAINSGEVPNYQEFSGGRNGQHVNASVDLPKSVADKLQKQLSEDPGSVRTLVEQLVLENSNGQVSTEDWRQGGKVKHPIRPPYEQLPKDWTMAVITGAEGSRASDYSVQRVATQ